MLKIKIIFIMFILFLTASLSFAGSYNIPITIIKVIDGDTVLAKIDNNIFQIRLYGIDCYETETIHRAYKQAYINKIGIEKVILQGKMASKILNQYIQKKIFYLNLKVWTNMDVL